MPDYYQVVILGSGYGGLMAALRLAGPNRLSRIALVGERAKFVERIRLQEEIAAPVADRLPAIAALLAGAKVTFIQGRVLQLDADNARVRVASADGEVELAFERCIYALGSHVDAATPGVADNCFCLDTGEGPRSVEALRVELESKAGTAIDVVVVGGANTATEAAGEIKSKWPGMNVTMVSRSRVGDFGKGARLEAIARNELERLGVRLVDGETVIEACAETVRTASGLTIAADVCVWAAGLRSPSIAKQAGLAVDDRGRILADPGLASISHPHILAIGDAVHPLAPSGARYRMSAFAAIISGAYAAKRLADEARGKKPRPFSFSAYGQGVAIGSSGVGFFTFPDDGPAYFILRGALALRIRNLFVWCLVFFLKLEQRFPGWSPFWIGRRRVSWKRANAAMRRARCEAP